MIKKISEFLICLLLTGSLFLLRKNRRYFDADVLWFMQAALVLTVGAELAFTFYVSVYGLFNLFGHLFKVLSFYCIYRAVITIGLVRPYDLLFKELEQYKNKLEEKVRERTAALQQQTANLNSQMLQREKAEQELRREYEVNKQLAEAVREVLDVPHRPTS